MKRMFLLSILFACLSLPSQAQLLINQTGISRPQTSDSGFVTYSFTKRILGGRTYNQNGTESAYFKFSGNTIYKRQYGSTYEFRYHHDENGCGVYYQYVAMANDPWMRDSYLLVSSDRSVINSVSVSGGETNVFKKGTASVRGLVK